MPCALQRKKMLNCRELVSHINIISNRITASFQRNKLIKLKKASKTTDQFFDCNVWNITKFQQLDSSNLKNGEWDESSAFYVPE